MNTQIHRIVTAHCTNHIERGEADAVWGEVLCSVGNIDRTALLPPAEWRVISFDGRRGNQITQRTKEYASQSAAESAFSSKWRAKQREGYDPVNWTDSFYGLISTIRDIDSDFFDMVFAESIRVGMDLSSPLWLSVSGLNGETVPRQELIDNFNRNRDSGFRGLPDQRVQDISQEQIATSGRFAPDPTIGTHVYLWNGLERDPNFERCGVCSKKLSKHQWLVVNYRGRLTRHIWRQRQINQWNCAICNLDRDNMQGRLVHSRFDYQVEWISGPQAQQIFSATYPSEAEIQTSTIYTSDIEPVEIDPEVERAVAGDLMNRIEERIFVNGSPANSTPRTRPATDKSKPKPSQPPKPESTSHERTGGLLDFDI